MLLCCSRSPCMTDIASACLARADSEDESVGRWHGDVVEVEMFVRGIRIDTLLGTRGGGQHAGKMRVGVEDECSVCDDMVAIL